MISKGMHIAAAAATLAVCSVPAWAQIATYTVQDSGQLRTFDFDGATPFRNPTTQQGDAATWQWNGSGFLRSFEMTDIGTNDMHIGKVTDTFTVGNTVTSEQVTRVALLRTDTNTAGDTAYRTQLNSFYIEPGKRYMLDLEFKLDKDWDFSTDAGTGLVWQLKGTAVEGRQKGNPSLALTLHGDQLKMTISYPRSAKYATTWPTQVSWDGSGYETVTVPAKTPVSGQYPAISIPAKTITADRYYRVQLVFFADDKPLKFENPALAGGNGYISATFDGESWFDYKGPTLHPDTAINPLTSKPYPHQIKWGWYQWDIKPTSDRIVYYRKHHLYEWK